MTRTALLKELKDRCKSDTEYNNILNYGLEFFKRLEEKGIRRAMPDCRTENFLVSLINEKVKELRRIKKSESDKDRRKEIMEIQKELILLKERLTGWGRV